MVRPAHRLADIQPFYVVELLKQAMALAHQGRDIISLGIGEPDFTAPPPVVRALKRAAQDGLSQYTPPFGLMALRKAIATDYANRYNITIDPARVVVTTGASGALLLATLAVVDPGSTVLMPDPCYPANRNFVVAAGGRPNLIPTTAAQRFQISAEDLRRHWRADTSGILVASPSNPTGTSLTEAQMAALLEETRQRNGFAIVDEIYMGLHYDEPLRSALTLDDDVLVINSFSKYFHMTGWRLGWLIVPESLIPLVDRLAASLAICAPSLAQHAALACFEPESQAEFERRRLIFQERRDYLLPELERLGLTVPAKPDGAFYVYADLSNLGMDSDTFSQRLLHEAGVVAVPGRDFGPAMADHMLRLSYATELPRLREAVTRIEDFLDKLPVR